jgi:uncharacterized protein YegJ (DUF2314 family)
MSQDETTPFASDDTEMQAAIMTAKNSLGQFLQAFMRPSKDQQAFLIKAVFVEGEQAEHIWLADLSFTGGIPRGVVANEPALPGMRFKQSVEIEPSQITDWMYVEDGYLVGGYTTRLIRQRMSPDERRDFDANAPFKIREVA